MQALKTKTIRGGAAKLVGQALGLLLRLGTLIVLARIIDPGDFGLVAMVTAVTGVFDIFATGGLSAATVQKADVSRADIHLVLGQHGDRRAARPDVRGERAIAG